jgi:hypothetical protein
MPLDTNEAKPTAHQRFSAFAWLAIGSTALAVPILYLGFSVYFFLPVMGLPLVVWVAWSVWRRRRSYLTGGLTLLIIWGIFTAMPIASLLLNVDFYRGILR